ncbi:hypothetical protein FDECE_5993 [Fusarium decemcellulare]|nr:hypothetical protein FDECE_5993 [Fusarium decemcellulare]
MIYLSDTVNDSLKRFNRSNRLVDFIDAGELRENADFKLKAILRRYADGERCRRVYFAAYRNVDYVSDLTPYRGNREKFTLIISNIPRRIQLLGPEAEVAEIDKLIPAEVKAEAGLDPISMRDSRHDNKSGPTKTILVSFFEKPHRRFQLFGTSRLTRHIEKHALIPQCERCWDFHPTRRCQRNEKCKKCGKLPYERECDTTQCANCRGPHEADFEKWLSRPRRVNKVIRRLSRNQKNLARQAGEKLWRDENPPVPESSPPAPNLISSPVERYVQTAQNTI